MQNFTVADLVQTTLATFVFALFLLPSGYLFGLASNIFGMRNRSAIEKVAFSAAFSIATTPILAVLLTRISSYKVTLAVFLLLAAIACSTLVRQLPLPAGFFSHIRRSTWILLGMTLAWFLLVQISLADLQVGNRLYVSYVAYDHSVRIPFVEAAARGGVPPLNPFYGLGKIPVLRYFYYWYVVCALPMQLFGLSAKGCLNASVFWSGIGLASTIPLFLKHFFGESEHLRRKSMVGTALLTVTGLDLIPYALSVYHYGVLYPDMEWWDTNQITSWLGSLLWVPHHVAALTACMTGLLVLSTVDEGNTPVQRAWAVVLSGLALASAAGLSVYVTFTFAVFAVLWALLSLAQKRIKSFVTYLAGGIFSLLLSLPYLKDLLSRKFDMGLGGAATGRGDRFAYFAIRDCGQVLEYLVRRGVKNPSLLNFSKFPTLFIVYALEFGFFAVAMVVYLRRNRQNPLPVSRQSRMAWMMFAVCLITLSILQSDSSGSNDLGFRGMLVVQYVLLMWAVPIIDDLIFSRSAQALASSQRWIRFALVGTLIIGVAGTAFQLVMLRCYLPLADIGKLPRAERYFGVPGFGVRDFGLRRVLGGLSELTPVDAMVQYNPVRDEVMVTHLYSPRQAVIGDNACGSAFGGDTAKCKEAFPYVAAAFNSPAAMRDWDIDRLCDSFRISVLVATDADPIWRDPYSWVWTRPAIIATTSVRAIRCGSSASSMASAR
jgi:hypothetical protein